MGTTGILESLKTSGNLAAKSQLLNQLLVLGVLSLLILNRADIL
ncbi:MAG TPA: hypothetical protein VMW53_06765 [archaeon]|nr:hypothetical protein [archaeon]